MISGRPVETSSGICTPSPYCRKPGPGARPAEGDIVRVRTWRRRAPVALAMLATVLWAVAAAAQEPVERALSLVSQEKYSEARAVLEPMLQREPDAPRLRLLNGILLAREGNAAEAIAVFERLRGDRSDMFEPYNNLAVLYAAQGRLDEAREVLMAALARRPDPVAFANLGDVYIRLADRAYSRARGDRSDIGAAMQRIPADRPVPPVSARPPDPPVPGTKPAAADDGPLAPAADFEETKTAEIPQSHCVEAGMFEDRKALAGAVDWLQSQGAEAIDLREDRNRGARSYRVYLPALPSAQAAAGKLRELRERGIGDVAVLRRGAEANRISLGVFKSKRNAERRVAALEKLGYSANWAATGEIPSAYAVRARAGGTRSAFASAWKGKFPGQPFEFVVCP